jgi:hypothetical protein
MSSDIKILPIEVAPDKIVDFLFVYGMKILELVDCTELDNIQTIGYNNI